MVDQLAVAGGRTDPGLALVLQKVGGWSGLARGLGVRRQSLDWARVPQGRLLKVARLAGLDPAEVRPDLADWAERERRQERMDRARSMFALGAASIVRATPPPKPFEDRIAGDMLTAMAACRFVAGERGLSCAQVLAGKSKDEAAARAMAMALAHIVGRASSETLGVMFGCSRQNVDNASERYLRARDGDDVEDCAVGADGLARVVERGRIRRAKTAAEDLWEAEGRFTRLLCGEETRKRA